MKYLIRFSAVILVVLGSDSLWAQWIQANGPYGGSMDVILVNGSTIFVSNKDGFYRSSDNGSRWCRSDSGLPENGWNICCLVGVPNDFGETTLYAGHAYDGLYESTDNGVSWTSVNNSTQLGNVHAIAVYPDSSASSGRSILVGGDQGGGVFRSTDNCANWSSVNNGLTNLNVWTFAVSSDSTHGTTLFVGTKGGGLFRSSDNGDHWMGPNPDITSPFIQCILVRNSNILVGTANDGIFRSTDNGISWTGSTWSLDDTAGMNNVRSFAECETTLFSGAKGVFMSTNEGATWNEIGLNLPWVGSLAALKDTSGTTTIFAGTGADGLYLSTDSGRSWRESDSGMTLRMLSVAATDSEVFTVQQSGGIFRSTDNGSTWVHANSGLASTTICLAILPNGQSGSTVYVGGGGGGRGQVYASTDDGNTWLEIDSHQTDRDIISIAINKADLFAGSRGEGVFHTSNNGIMWSTASNGLLNDTINALLCSDEFVLAGTNSGVFKSTDTGMSWQLSGLEGNVIGALAVSDSIIFAEARPSGLCQSTDGGSTWSTFQTLSKQSTVTLARGSRPKSSGFLPDLSGIKGLAANNEYLFAATSIGVWKLPVSDISIVRAARSVAPAAFRLDQNYPNPFNPSTQITYDIPKPSQVSLIIYDVLGREVAVLVNSYKLPGEYQATFNGSGLPSGVYFYRIQAGNYTAVKKLLLLK